MLWIFTIGISAAIIAIAVMVGQQRGKKLMAEGKIIKRDISFIESTETFTLAGVEFAKLTSALQRMDTGDTGVSWKSKDAAQAIIFQSSHGWNAQLSTLENSNDKNRYCFQFTSWQTRKGIPWRVDTMNMLLTAIEKMFLSLDPNTQVETARVKTKTKSSFL